MSDTAIAGMVVGVVGIFCFCAVVLTLGILAILHGLGFTGRATKEGVEVVASPANPAAPLVAVEGAVNASTSSMGAARSGTGRETFPPLGHGDA